VQGVAVQVLPHLGLVDEPHAALLGVPIHQVVHLRKIRLVSGLNKVWFWRGLEKQGTGVWGLLMEVIPCCLANRYTRLFTCGKIRGLNGELQKFEHGLILERFREGMLLERLGLDDAPHVALLA
jgi:hypothetical protein